MELTELVSPHIAVPVIGVVVCAIMVFAFGFRSPVQPPSFNFEEKRSKKRTKQTKPKGSVNDHLMANDQALEIVPKVSSKPSKEVKGATLAKPAASPKAELSESKIVTKKELKQDIRGDKKGKLKKENVKEDVKIEGGKRNKTLPVKKEAEDDGEWTTIQISKKSKKQKSSGKKDSGQAESAVELESETENVPTPTSDAAAASAVFTSEVEEPSSPQARKTKKKEEKLPGRSRGEDKEESQSVPILEKQDNQDLGDGKKKKSKKDKKSSPGAEAAASSSENVTQDVAASGKDSNKNVSPVPVVSAVVNTEQAKPTSGKKKKGKENIQEETIVKTLDVQLKEVKKSADPTRKDADVQLKAVKKSSDHIKKDTEVQLKEVKKSADSVKKDIQLKEVKKSADPVKKDVDIQLIEVEKPVDITKKDKKNKPKALTKALRVESEISATSVLTVESVNTSGDAPTDTVAVGVSFDEIGDSWQEAAPKSKKKKPRKDN